jgi:hypothetical protein
MDDVLIAFKNLLDSPNQKLGKEVTDSRKTNDAGNPLERFVKDAFASSIGLGEDERDLAWANVFSYVGNSGNPPDALVRGGVAIETKKSGGLKADIQLNSSPPKRFLKASDSRILEKAKNAEKWKEKPLVYAIGTVKRDQLQRLWLIYGECFIAEDSVYDKIAKAITRALTENSGIRLHPTNELASVRDIDPTNRTNLRVRGMWTLMNPNKAFETLTNNSSNCQYYLLMPESEYQKASQVRRSGLETLMLQGYQNRIIQLPDPSDPSERIEARFLSYEF